MNEDHLMVQLKLTSLFLTLFLFNNFFFETMPTENPAKSNLLFAYVPGISAVSPPTRTQSDILQPLLYLYYFFHLF